VDDHDTLPGHDHERRLHEPLRRDGQPDILGIGRAEHHSKRNASGLPITSLRLERKVDRERGARARLALDADRSAVRFHD
jgi:hypothetical protein